MDFFGIYIKYHRRIPGLEKMKDSNHISSKYFPACASSLDWKTDRPTSFWKRSANKPEGKSPLAPKVDHFIHVKVQEC